MPIKKLSRVMDVTKNNRIRNAFARVPDSADTTRHFPLDTGRQPGESIAESEDLLDHHW